MADLTRLLTAHTFRTIDRRDAQNLYADFRAENGATRRAPALLTAPEENVKFDKTANPVYGLALAPDRLSGLQVCRFSTPDCRKGCVAFAGKGELASVIAGRVRKTQFLAQYPNAFYTLLVSEIARAEKRYGRNLRVRLNTFSDLPWETLAPSLFAQFSHVTFYDYTKHPFSRSRDLPNNYTLTYSVSERSDLDEIVRACQYGANCAIIFGTKRGHDLPKTWRGLPVVDGDASDDRTLDPCGVIVGLRAKGRMRTGRWPMVIDPITETHSVPTRKPRSQPFIGPSEAWYAADCP